MRPRERRTFPRLKLPSGCWATYAEGAGAIVDLSLNGVRIDDPEPLRVGATFDLTLRIGDEAFPCRGTVRRQISSRGMGVALLNLTTDDRTRLRVAVQKLPRF